MENKIKETIHFFSEKLKADKKSMLIIAIGILGMVLIFASELTDTDKTDVTVNEKALIYDETVRKEELEKIISEISGVGRAKVMITYECTRESIFACDTIENTQEKDKKISSEHIIVDSGNTEEGLLIKEVLPKVMGVAVVCEGGDNPTVKNEITMLIKAIFDISSNNISISEMQK